MRTVAPAPGLHSRLSCLGPAGAASDAGEAACSPSRWRVLTYQMNNVYNFDNLLIAKLPEVVRANSGGALDPHTVAASGCIRVGLQPGAMGPQAACVRLHLVQAEAPPQVARRWSSATRARPPATPRRTTATHQPIGLVLSASPQSKLSSPTWYHALT